MKTTVYLRVGKNGRKTKIAATVKPSQAPLETDRYVLPTCAFAIELDIPDEAFTSAARVVAKLKVPEEKLTIAAEVLEMETDK